jgi:nucleotide-binding universal stress UspA family protein
MTHRILVCLDGSTLSERALPRACVEAQTHGSTIVLFRVCERDILMYATPIPGQAGIVPFDMLERNASDCEARARAYLDRVARDLISRGIETECVVGHGLAAYVADMIADFAADNSIDLIAMATRGYKGWKRLVLSSVTASVKRKTTTPVVVVNPDREIVRNQTAEVVEDRLGLSAS